MKINSIAMSLTVADVKASSDFFKKHFAFMEKWSADGFSYLVHESFDMQGLYKLRYVKLLYNQMLKSEGLK